MPEQATETRGIKIAVVSYSGLVVLQFIAYYLTGTLVLRAQALEMLSDVMISSFLLVSILWARKPADEFHMFVHGRAQNVAALVSATVLIFLMSIETFREAIPSFFRVPETVESQNPILAFSVVIIGMLVVSIPTVDLIRSRAKGASAGAQLISLLKDEISYVAALLAILLTTQGYVLADAAGSTFVGAIIALSGIYLLKGNVDYLVGRSPGNEYLRKVKDIAGSVRGVLGVHDLKAEYVGPNTVHAGLHVEVARNTPIEEADRIAHEVEAEVGKETGCQHCVVHVDPVDSSVQQRQVR